MHLQNLLRHINKTFWKHGKVTLFPGRVVATSHQCEHPSPTEAVCTEYEILVGWIFALLPRYLLPSTHRGTSSSGHGGFVWFKILCRKSDSNKQYFKRQNAISIGWDVKYKTYTREGQWCNDLLWLNWILDWSYKPSKFDCAIIYLLFKCVFPAPLEVQSTSLGSHHLPSRPKPQVTAF